MFRQILAGAVIAATSLSSFAVQSWDTTTPTSAVFSADQSSTFNFVLSGAASVFSFASTSSDLFSVTLDGYSFTKVLDTPDLWTLSLSSLSAGAHQLSVYTASNFVNGQDTFTGQVSIQGATFAAANVSAVPEPDAGYMMLAGLGVVGWVMRRRMPR